MSRALRSLRLVAALVLLAGCLTGCMGVPSAGPVVSVGADQQTAGDTGIAIDPRPPRSGMSPQEIVDGFLEAMLATPLQTSTAQQYLTRDARAAWDPSDQVMVYSDREAATTDGDHVTVTLGAAWSIDERGAWEGAVPDADRALGFDVVQVDGQWRIARAPDALIVPDWWFEGRYQQMSLYYFNADHTMLVPEPVFVPRGNELATVLVRDLVLGPGAGLDGVVHSVVPEGVGQGLSVPVDEDGVADIALTGGAAGSARPLTTDEVALLTAQLAWTLRQDPDIREVRLSIGGQPVLQPDGHDEFGVDAGPRADPVGYQSSQLLYGLREGRVVAGTLPTFRPTTGLLGRRDHGVRSIAIDLRATQVAAVSTSGTSLLLASMTSLNETLTTPLTGATDLLKPAWDGVGRLWLVDRRDGGAVVRAIVGSRVVRVRVPGVSGADVRRFVVSRDGTRLIAVVRTKAGDSVVVTRIATGAGDVPSGVGPARVISDDAGAVDDLAWSSTTTVRVLRRLGENARVTTLPIDGSGAALLAGGTLVGQPLTALVGSPATGQVTLGVDGQRLVSLSSLGGDQTLSDAVTALTYAG
ncbi:MAG: LpqB family beta-propeller domain-containing protein [Nocardioides sp.]|uniref:LpqB family beta-propeller domain-containing protein n=1 Tax=Nocardioides sp. TaxID=35761 RepID=UPI0039E6D4ED